LPQRLANRIAMMLVIVPFWTSFLIRIYAWINILQHDGPAQQGAAGAAHRLKRRWCGCPTDRARCIFGIGLFLFCRS